MSKEFISIIAVMLKEEFDPLGDHLVKKAQSTSLKIKNIHTGKLFELKYKSENSCEAKDVAANMTGKLLANNNIEKATEIGIFNASGNSLLRVKNPDITYGE